MKRQRPDLVELDRGVFGTVVLIGAIAPLVTIPQEHMQRVIGIVTRGNHPRRCLQDATGPVLRINHNPRLSDVLHLQCLWRVSWRQWLDGMHSEGRVHLHRIDNDSHLSQATPKPISYHNTAPRIDIDLGDEANVIANSVEYLSILCENISTDEMWCEGSVSGHQDVRYLICCLLSHINKSNSDKYSSKA